MAGLAVAAPAAESFAATQAPAPVTDAASLVNPLIGTTDGVDEFPGPDMPFGMMQWGPDTSPSRPDGGGYDYAASQISGYSLTHLSGPGCATFGDVPILPTVGAIGSDPGSTTETFTHSEETAQVGYYSDTLGNGVGVQLTDATRSGIGEFTFPASTEANLLLKLSDSAAGVDSTSVQTVGDDEVQGEVTSGHFCGNPWESDYTLYFDIVFSQPFTASTTWQGTSRTGSSLTGGMALTFDTTSDQTVMAKAGISFTSAAGASGNLSAEIPGWGFAGVQQANISAWNGLLGSIQVGGGSAAQQTEFYTALYHSLLDPSIFSDENGQYTGVDGKIHTVASGHAEYADYSGWDIYRSQVQLVSMLAPQQASDMVTSMLNDYAQGGTLPKWDLADGETYAMAGDPADPIIADAYAFGATGFDASTALSDMIAQATTTNNVRTGQSLLSQDGYLPFDASYGCCSFYGPVSEQLEYDTDDYAIAALAKATGDTSDYQDFATQAQSWQNIFNLGTGYVQPKMTDGTWVGGFTPGQLSGYVEGTAAQYTPMVPFDLGDVIAARGGDAAWISYLNGLMTNLSDPGRTNADLTNEPSLEIPYEYDYAGAPYLTQEAVTQVEALYSDTPDGEPGNDDLGEMSSSYVWDELGFYPETPGTSVLALGSPAFPLAEIHLPDGKEVTISAPAAAAGTPYVQSLTVNGTAWQQAYVNFQTLESGATLDYDLSSSPDTSWAAAAPDAPPSDTYGAAPAIASAGPLGGLILAPGASGTASFDVANLTQEPMTVSWTATPASGVTVSQASGTLTVPAGSRGQATLTVAAGSGTADGRYPLTFAAVTSAGASLPGTALAVDVASAGATWPYDDQIGIASDGQSVSDGIDGSQAVYSMNALEAAGDTPGSTITVNGVNYTWPSAAAGEPDSIDSDGQVIPVSFPAGTTTIGLLGSCVNATTAAGTAGGTMTVTYTDGSTQQVQVAFSGLSLDSGQDQPLPSNTIAAEMPYVDAIFGFKLPVEAYVFAVSATLESGKTVASVTLPVPSGGDIGIFAIGAG